MLRGYYCGKEPNCETFSDFCIKYLNGKFGQNCKNKRTFKKVYDLFRNKLVHNAIPGGLISIQRSQVIWKDKGKLFMDANRLFEAVEDAFVSYFRDIESDEELLTKFYNWHVKVTDEISKSSKYI